MAIKSRQELLDGFKQLNDGSDNTIAFLEDLQDTLNDLETKTSDSTDWKKKFEDNDAEWRKRYTERFFEDVPDTGKKPINDDKPRVLSYEDLFKED